jgi:hypothetical protein
VRTRISLGRIILRKDFNAADLAFIVRSGGNAIVGDGELFGLLGAILRRAYNVNNVPELVDTLFKVLGDYVAARVALFGVGGVFAVVIVEYDSSLVTLPMSLDIDILVGGLVVPELNLIGADCFSGTID